MAQSRGVQYCADASGAGGRLRCQVFGRELDTDGFARFSIAVENATANEAHVLAFVPNPLATNRQNVVRTTIAARSEFSTSATLAMPQPGAALELHVVLTSSDIHFTLVVPGVATAAAPVHSAVSDGGLPALRARLPAVRESYALATPMPAPPAAPLVRMSSRDGDRPRASPPGIPVLAVFAALLAMVAFTVSRPRIDAFAIPADAHAGQPLLATYQAAGFGTVTYTLLGADGTRLGGGPLAAGAGSFRLALPAATSKQAYLVRLRVSNPFESAAGEAYVRVAADAPPATVHRAPVVRRPAHAAPPPQIRSLALDRATLAGGETLGVYYDMSATSGSVTLSDPAAQITYARAPTNASGHVAFVVPHVDAARLLSVTLSAQRGAAATQSRIALTVTPAAAPDAAPAADGSMPAGAQDGLSGVTVTTELSAPATVQAGRAVRVEVNGGTTGTPVVLLDTAGVEYARRILRAGQQSVTFVAPSVPKPKRFIFEATAAHGAGSDTIVRAITVTP